MEGDYYKTEIVKYNQLQMTQRWAIYQIYIVCKD